MASVALIVWATLLPGNEIAPQLIPPRWCLRCGGLWMTDAISNVVLFTPFGIALALRGVSWWRVGLTALLFSFGVETLQALGIPSARSAALADIITNTTGGLVGAAIVVLWPWVTAPSARVAQRLTIAWACLASVLFWLTAIALGPRSVDDAGDMREAGVEPPAPTLSKSPYPRVPRQAYFGGVLDSAIVGGAFRVQRGWPGPVIVQASREAMQLETAVFVRGRDIEAIRVPIVYVHTPGDSSPLMQLSSRGDDAELSVTRRAWDWGLALPSAMLEGVFRGRSPNDPRPLRLLARMGRDTLQLWAEAAHFRGGAALALTPTLGWALIQTLVDPSSPLAPVFLGCWLAALVLPIGWWAVRGGRSGVWWSAVAVCGVTGVLLLLPQLTGVAPVSLAQWLAMAGWLAGGMLGSKTVFRGTLPT